MPRELYTRLGSAEPPPDGEYFVPLYTYLKDVLQVEQEDRTKVIDQQGWASQRPWVEKDYPDVAAWLKTNEKPLAVVAEAARRPAYYNPLVSSREPGDPSSLVSCLLPGVQKCREITSALTARAMLRLGSGNPDGAWDDLMTCHRLARHLTHGATIIESLVSIAIRQIAQYPTLAYLEHAPLTSKQILAKLKELQDLPPAAVLADKLDLGERLMCLDSLQTIRRGAGPEGNEKPTPEEQKALDLIDWAPAFRSCNKWYDRMVLALRVKDRDAREKAFAAVENELDALVKKNRGLGDLKKLLDSAAPGKEVGRAIGDLLMALMAPALRKVQSAHDRMEQAERNLHVAFALAAYRKDAGKYPAALGDLAPTYLAAIPGDVFSGKPLIYKPGDAGYLFYSLGTNGKDDEGRWYDDDPPGDDPRVKVPLPPLKKEK
jgi:hypothetical protein